MGPIIGVFAIIDVGIHLYFDYQKARVEGSKPFREPSSEVPSIPLGAAAISTILAFVLVLMFPVAWILGIGETYLQFQIPLIIDPPDVMWIIGFAMLAFGIVLHAWSRYHRRELASSWSMRDDHKLITTGPYAKVRHPSYTSYLICFIAIFLMMPTILSMVLFVGIWGYYEIAINEEDNLLQQFGGAYKEYMKRTGRFFLRIL
ncbi:MAG: methyltransferase family protein [Candidatus Thorarchaeota archaeon]